MAKQTKAEKEVEESFRRFENLTKNLISVSNAEVRQIMAEEKRVKESKKEKRKGR